MLWRKTAKALAAQADTRTMLLIKAITDDGGSIIGQERDHGDPFFEGGTLLHFASAAGDLDSVRRLLKAGASITAVNWRGQTPWECATANGHTEVARTIDENRSWLARPEAVDYERENKLIVWKFRKRMAALQAGRAQVSLQELEASVDVLESTKAREFEELEQKYRDMGCPEDIARVVIASRSVF